MEHRTRYINRIIIALVVWQFFSLLMITIFNWPKELIWLNFGFLAVFVLFADVFQSLVLLIASIPFYAALPNPYFETLSIWRLLFALLFVVWVVRDLKIKISDIRFMAWDKILGYFFAIAIITTLFFAKFPWQGIKQLLFFVNIYLAYIVVINAVKSREQVFRLLKSAAWSLGILITLGFVQLATTFFTDFETFWVYWADNIARVFYGDSFAQVALYSNSWFSYTGGQELRMFSILPDSQSFAYLCVFAIAVAMPLTLAVSNKSRPWLWSGVRSAALAVMLSGTRAVWVGVLTPFFTLLGLYLKGLHKFFSKRILFVIGFILFLFAISPLINAGLSALRYSRQENFINRAKSIYNLREVSNAGRILIWSESFRNFAQKPWGIGLDNFISTLNESENYKQAAEEVNQRYNLPQKYITAHSLYLQILVELGLIGLAVFVWFWFVVGKTFVVFLKQYKASEDALAFFVFSSAMVFLWLLAAAVFDVTWFNDKVLMYFFLILGLAGVVIKRFEEMRN